MPPLHNEHRHVEEEGFSDPAINREVKRTRSLAGNILRGTVTLTADAVELGANTAAYTAGRIQSTIKTTRDAYRKGKSGKWL